MNNQKMEKINNEEQTSDLKGQQSQGDIAHWDDGNRGPQIS
jgi:hypothetical protein